MLKEILQKYFEKGVYNDSIALNTNRSIESIEKYLNDFKVVVVSIDEAMTAILTHSEKTVILIDFDRECDGYYLHNALTYASLRGLLVIGSGYFLSDKTLFKIEVDLMASNHEILEELLPQDVYEKIKEYEIIPYVQDVHKVIRFMLENKEEIKEEDLKEFTKSNDRNIQKVYFKDIKGHDNHKELIGKIINSDIKGVLLYGKPGTGKTMFAKAVSNEFSLPFEAVSSADLVHSRIGESEHAIHKFFQSKSRKILFIDEIDTLFGKYDRLGPVSRQLLNQFLVEMDRNNKTLVIGATNYIRLLDDSLFTSGRFDICMNFDDKRGI
jgi:DNA replication protein DnaC